MGLTPSKQAVTLGHKRDKAVTKKRINACKPAAKRRRLQLKGECHSIQAASEVCEGITYQASIGMAAPEEETITSIPNHVLEPQAKPMQSYDWTEVFFDLETTGLGKYYYFITFQGWYVYHLNKVTLLIIRWNKYSELL